MTVRQPMSAGGRGRARRRLALVLAALVAAALPAVVGAPPAFADSGTTVGFCDAATLRAVVAAAPAGSTVAITCTGTIGLSATGGPLVLDKDLTLDASRAPGIVALSGQGTTNVLVVDPSATVTIDGLTITAGSAPDTGINTPTAGGITNFGTLTLENTTVTGNTGPQIGGIYNTASLTVTASTISDNSAPTAIIGRDAAGITNAGALAINASTVSGNDGGLAPLLSWGRLTVTDSTFAHNNDAGIATVCEGATDGCPGAIAADGPTTITGTTFSDNQGVGAAALRVNANSRAVSVTNSTFVGNAAVESEGQFLPDFVTGTIVVGSGALSVVHTTITRNRAVCDVDPCYGGLSAGITLDSAGGPGATASLSNTVLAANSTQRRITDSRFYTDPAPLNCAVSLSIGAISDADGNLSDDDSCAFTNSASRNNATSLNLGPLTGNGGPTETIALGADSSAIGFAPCLTDVITDQRGLPRPAPGQTTCDSGAFELQPTSPPTPSATALSGVSGSGTFDGTATLTATLTTTGDGHAVAGETVSFTLNGAPVGSASTDPAGVASLAGVDLSGLGAGSHPGAVGVVFAGDDAYAASSGSGNLDVAKAGQTISFDPLPDATYGEPAFDVSGYAAASSGLTITFSSATTAVCTVSGSTVRIVAAGVCTIDADQAGDADTNPAAQASKSFAVQPAALIITAGSPTVSYGDPAPAITAGYAGFVNGDNPASLAAQPSCSTSYSQGEDAGSYSTSCTGASAANYTVSYTDGTLTVLAALLTVTADDESVQYSDPLPTLTAHYSGFVLGQDPSMLSGTLTCSTGVTLNSAGQVLSAAGTYPITCTGLDAGNYTLSYRSGTLTVAREDTVVRLAQNNPHAVQVTAKGKTVAAPALTFTARITGQADGYYGDISLAKAITLTLTPIGPGGTTSYPCIPGTVQPATNTSSGFEFVSCAVPAGVPINVYQVSLTVGGNYYQGADDSVLTVYDPTDGGSTGAGTVTNPNTGNQADFAYSTSYLKNGGVKGKFLYISRNADGTVAHVFKGNAINTMAINGSTAIVTGKATLDGVGNYTYILTGIDNGTVSDPNPGDKPDQFGLQVSDGSGKPVAVLTFKPVDIASNGNISVGK